MREFKSLNRIKIAHLNLVAANQVLMNLERVQVYIERLEELCVMVSKDEVLQLSLITAAVVTYYRAFDVGNLRRTGGPRLDLGRIVSGLDHAKRLVLNHNKIISIRHSISHNQFNQEFCKTRIKEQGAWQFPISESKRAAFLNMLETQILLLIDIFKRVVRKNSLVLRKEILRNG